jgi:hypothetical protein
MGYRMWSEMETPKQARRGGETWDDHWRRRLQQSRHGADAARGERTKPPQPEGTTPLERDQRPINQSR